MLNTVIQGESFLLKKKKAKLSEIKYEVLKNDACIGINQSLLINVYLGYIRNIFLYVTCCFPFEKMEVCISDASFLF